MAISQHDGITTSNPSALQWLQTDFNNDDTKNLASRRYRFGDE